jgi:tetratricopeptide (TPR) repeat protein
MGRVLNIIWQIGLTAFVVGFFGWVLFRWSQRSRDEPKVLARKLVYTVLVALFACGAAILLGVRGYARGDPGAWTFGVFPLVVLVCGIIFSVIWTPNIGAWLASPVTNLIDGGNQPPEPKPFYSVARGLRAKGKYPDAIAEIQKQLSNFPGDLEGTMLQAEIQVENLHDLPAAEATVQGLLDDPKQTPTNIAFALNTLADWHWKYGRDRDTAKRDLEQVIELFPDSEAALGAAQRIAHLGDEGMMRPLDERKKVFVPEGIKNFGLVKERGLLKPQETDPEKLTVEYVKHLEQYPQDTETREKLALLYADHYQRLDLAADQLEQLISQPNQPPRHVSHWLNLLADLQIRCAGNYDAARLALQRIVDLYPNQAVAELAHNRTELLRLEMKTKEKSQAVKLGSYEQNLGLKRGLPHKF